MVSHSTANYLNSLLEGILAKETSVEEKLLEIDEAYTILLKQLTRGEAQFFPNNYSRSVFVIDRYQLPELVGNQLRALGFLLSKARKGKTVDGEDARRASKLLCNCVEYFSETKAPDGLLRLLDGTDISVGGFLILPKEQIDFLQLDVLEVSEKRKTRGGEREYFYLIGMSEEYGKMRIYLWEEFVYLQPMIWKYARMNISAVNIDHNFTSEDKVPNYSTSKETLVVLDPDFLLDASAIAKCHVRVGANPIMYLAKKFEVQLTNYYFMRGTVVNEYLDEAIAGNNATAGKLFREYIQSNPTYALVFDESDREKLVKEVQPHFMTLNAGFIPAYKNKELSTEPTFLSEKFGIRGRLDVLVKHQENPDRQDVVELKTSKDPAPWGNPFHMADHTQAVCYNLLLNTINENQTGSSSILYSSAGAQNNALRNVPNDVRTKRNVLNIRNVMAYYEYQMTQNAQWPMGLIDLANFQKQQLWENESRLVEDVKRALDTATELEKQYLFQFATFIAREQRAAKVGASNEKGDDGFSSLWYHSRTEKERNYAIMAWLEYERIQGEGKEKKVFFKKSASTLPVSKFREGDFILLYAQGSNGEVQPTRNQIIKANIKELSNNHVAVSPMNRHLEESFFRQHQYWAIETELFELGFEAMYQSLLQFLQGDERKKRLLLGLERPAFGPSPQVHIPGLKPKQLELLNQALSAKDYFLLQGPPGTGKTKYLLKELVVELLRSPGERLLLLAYTNRAVDEICEAVKSISPRPAYFRLGYSGSTDHEEDLLSRFAEGKALSEIRHGIQSCRIFVSTVLTLQRNPELTSKLKFTTAIVDEASQLLEPQIIGVLTHVERFILIGDEKQLPAVVIQSDQPVKTENELLNGIGVKDFRCSLFERLLHRSETMGWNEAHGMLVDQGRMHIAIQDLPNRLFYDNELQPINGNQSEKVAPYLVDIDNSLTKILKEKRAIFFATDPTKERNQNGEEARIVKWVTEKLWPGFAQDGEKEKSESIGIITPYRAQIAAIKCELSGEILNYVTIDTVERYQGGQRRAIIISFAVNNPYQLEYLQVLNEDETVDKKLNVALTRAKDYVILVGCPAVLSSAPIYQELFEDYYGRKAVYRLKTTTKANA